MDVFQFWVWLLRYLSYVVSKSSSFLKIFEPSFPALCFYIWAQKVCLKFLKYYVLCSVLFSRYVQLKSSFFDKKKHQGWNLRHTLGEKLSKINVAKYQKKIPSLTEVEALQLFIMQDYTESANGDVPLIVGNVWYF